MTANAPADQAAHRDRIAEAARTVRLRLGPNAIAMAQRGEPIILSLGEADDVADAVLAVLPPPADRAAVLRETIDVAREEGHRPEEEAGIEAARGARCVAYLLRKLLAKEQPPRSLADETTTETPAAVDRPTLAAVLREAADALGRMDYDADSNDYGYDTYRDAWNGGVMDAADRLRRMADETATTETQPATLSPAERTMLDYALNQAQLRMWDTGKYTAEEQAALVSLRRLTTEPAAGARQDGEQPAEADVEHCVHDRNIHTRHHHQPVTGCPWCTATTEAQPPGLRERHRAAWNALTPEQQAARLAELDADDEQDGAQP